MKITIMVECDENTVSGVIEKLIGVPSTAAIVHTPDAVPIASTGTPTPPATAGTPVASVSASEIEAGAVSTVPAAEGVELDENGIPWDGRIHASTKTKTKEGTWTRKRGVSREEHDAIAKTLTGAPAPAAPVEQPVVPTVAETPAPAAPVAAPAPVAVPTTEEPELPLALDRRPEATTARSPEPVAQSPEYTEFKALIDHHVFHNTSGFNAWLKESMTANNVTSLPELADRSDLWEFFTSVIVQHFGEMPNG